MFRITYLHTARCTVLLQKLFGFQPVEKFPAFHGTRRFVTALTSVRQLSLSWASPIQSIYPHPTSSRSILILSTHLRLGLPSGVFPSDYLLTHTLTPRCTVLLQKLFGFQPVEKFPAFHGTRKFVNALTSVRHLSLSWASRIQSAPPHPTTRRSILILSFNLRMGLPIGPFPHHQQNPKYASTLPIRATCPVQYIFLDLFPGIIFGKQYSSLSFSLCSFLHSPVASSHLCSNILPNTLSQNTLSQNSYYKLSDQVSHPYKNTGKIIVGYILDFKFLDSILEDKRFCTE